MMRRTLHRHRPLQGTGEPTHLRNQRCSGSICAICGRNVTVSSRPTAWGSPSRWSGESVSSDADYGEVLWRGEVEGSEPWWRERPGRL